MSHPGRGDLITGRYRLLEELGSGGMGVVFRARDEGAGNDVAVKILRRTTPEATRRFQREATATEGLDPTRIARVQAVGETPTGQSYIVMEYVEGRTLRAILKGGAVERREALRVVREIGTTLAQAHAVGLVHRDVKPDNVIVRSDGRVVLLDFGVAKYLDGAAHGAQLATQLTSDGAMIGTPAYLAPEQALGRAIDPAVDQFALAVTAFELLTGCLPWTATDVTRMLAQLLAESPRLASLANPLVPSAFDAVLSRALAKAPEARYPTVQEFVEALDAAEHGTPVQAAPPRASVDPSFGRIAPPVRDGPALTTRGRGALAGSVTSPPPRRWPRLFRLLAAVVIFAGAVGIGAGVLRARGWGHVAPVVPRALAVSSDNPLACPIFAVEGLPEGAAKLGAAASSLACARAKWFLGGSDDVVLVPAALVDAPVQPLRSLRDFYEAPGLRERSLAVAKARGLASLDGTVKRTADSWRVQLVLRAPDGEEIAQVAGEEAPYLESAMRAAVGRLWQTAPLVPAALDPDVARWTAYPDIAAGLMDLDLHEVGASTGACERVRSKAAELGRAYYPLRELCPRVVPLLDAGALAIDRSSPAALVTSLNAVLIAAPTNPFSDDETRRLALELESMRASERSRFGRASLARLAGLLWSLVNEVEHAHTAFFAAASDDPILLNDWYQLRWIAGETGSSEDVTLLASVWFPQEPAFFEFGSTTRSDVLAQRLRDGQLAYVLEPTPTRIAFLGRALAEAGRADEVRALAATTPADRPAPDPSTATFLLGCIDLHDARFAQALPRFESAGSLGLRTVPMLTEVLGQTGTTASSWARSFLDLPDAKAKPLAQVNAGTAAVCMNAGQGLGGRCLARVEKLGGRSAWGVGGDLFLRGAKLFAAGNERGAVDAWRPIVAGPNDDLARLLPTGAFEGAGERDLAARIDARKMAYRQLAGISEAAPREARRALERGDRARAKELGTSVIQAWEAADAPVPAVAEMRALLAGIGD